VPLIVNKALKIGMENLSRWENENYDEIKRNQFKRGKVTYKTEDFFNSLGHHFIIMVILL